MGRMFGTDGVRGIANEVLTCEMAMLIGRAAADVLTTDSRRRPLFVVGWDTRLSSDMLGCALMAGLCSTGADVRCVGVIPTPGVAYLVGKYKADAGVMISASHNPAVFNGIKLFNGDGYKLPDALEEQIEGMVLGDLPFPTLPTGDHLGQILQCPDAAKDYIRHLKSTVLYAPEGLRVGVDCANGAAYAVAEPLLTALGVEVTMLHNTPNGSNINQNCGSTHMEDLIGLVKENHLDAGIAFDGDADRCLAVDEQGCLVDGDQIMAICGLDLAERGRLAGNALVGTVMSNFGLSKFCEANGLKLLSTKVGDRFVLEEMLLEDYNFGGEQSGHLIFRDFATTGDGALTAIQLLSLMRRKGKPLSALATVMEKYPQCTVNIPATQEQKLAFYTDKTLREAADEVKKRLGDCGRLVVRPSGTEPLIRVMVECNDPILMKQEAEGYANLIQQQLSKKG